jgi:hypothetical protein
MATHLAISDAACDGCGRTIGPGLIAFTNEHH